MTTIISGIPVPVSLGLTSPFYKRALELFEHLEKRSKDGHSLGYSLHSVGNFPKINFFTVDEFGDGNAHYLLQAAVAGYDVNEIEVLADYKARTITIQNIPKKPPTDEELKEADKREGFVMDTWVQEIKQSAFNRTITLPDNANLDSLSSEYRNGILEITIPINKESATVSKVPIKLITN